VSGVRVSDGAPTKPKKRRPERVRDLRFREAALSHRHPPLLRGSLCRIAHPIAGGEFGEDVSETYQLALRQRGFVECLLQTPRGCPPVVVGTPRLPDRWPKRRGA